MASGTLLLGVTKYALFQDAMSNAALADLTPLSGQESGRVQIMIPVGGSRKTTVKVPAGDWLVQARLPSGEVLAVQVQVEEGSKVAPALQAAESARETWSWPTTLSCNAAALLKRSGGKTESDDERFEVLLGALDELELLLWNPKTSKRLTQSDDWERVGRGHDMSFDTRKCSLPEGSRAFVKLRDSFDMIALPLPWAGETYIQVKVVPEPPGGPDELSLRAWILDDELAPVLAFLEASDFEAARMLSEPLSQWAEKMLQAKRANPLAAAAGGLALVRLRAYDGLHNWPLNLAEWFDWLPDGSALAAWCVLRLGMNRSGSPLSPDQRAESALPHLQEAFRRGAPYFSTSVALLYEVYTIIRHSPHAQRITKAAAAWMERLFQSVKPGSFVASYQVFDSKELNALVRGAKIG
jgi:hypothetical protein